MQLVIVVCQQHRFTRKCRTTRGSMPKHILHKLAAGTLQIPPAIPHYYVQTLGISYRTNNARLRRRELLGLARRQEFAVAGLEQSFRFSAVQWEVNDRCSRRTLRHNGERAGREWCNSKDTVVLGCSEHHGCGYIGGRICRAVDELLSGKVESLPEDRNSI